jgi:uncharacterized damage-inducible protein DinB
MNEAIETWEINNRINIYLLEAINDDWLGSSPSSKGRNVGDVFAHMHNVRLMWLKASAPKLMDGQVKIEKDDILNKELLVERLNESAEGICALLEEAAATGKVKGFKPHPTAFLGYMIAHESHHRGQITLALKQTGHKLDSKVIYGMWEWGAR